MLHALGLSTTEQALYELLLTCPPISAAELHALTEGKAWRKDAGLALRRLEELGLVARPPAGPQRYLAVPPDAALDALLTAQEQALAATRQRVTQLTARYRQGAAGRHPRELIEIVHGRDAVQARLKHMLRGTRLEMRAFDAPPYLSPASIPNIIEDQQLERGIRYRVIYDRRGVDQPGRLAHIGGAVALGEQARVTDVPMKLGLSDLPMAMLPLRNNPVDIETWLVVHDSVLLDALSALFELYWAQAIPLHVKQDQPDLSGHDTPNAMDRALLPLLAAGLTDQAIADHLGLHQRTAHRHLRDMMRRLNAATRFQAGYQAVRRGWLTMPEASPNRP